MIVSPIKALYIQHISKSTVVYSVQHLAHSAEHEHLVQKHKADCAKTYPCMLCREFWLICIAITFSMFENPFQSAARFRLFVGLLFAVVVVIILLLTSL